MPECRYPHDFIFLLILITYFAFVLAAEAAAVLRRDRATFKAYVDASLRGRAVQGVDFERNPSIKG